MTCWMCKGKTKVSGRCVTCQLTRCIACGGELTVFVRMVNTVKFRKKQWANEIYEHEAYVKTQTFERLCLNHECKKHWDAEKLPPNWQIVKRKPVLEKAKKSFDEALAEIEQIVQEQL